MKKIINLLPFILLGIVVLFSLGNTLQYYFYTDDFAFLYYLGNNYEFGWPYSAVLPLFRPVYNLFGIDALPYFALALLTYFLATIAVYFFAKHLTHNKLIAYLSSLIFATGYIGLDQFGMIAVSIINNLNVINVCISLILLIYWIETKKLRYYFLTFFMFWFSMWLFPYRAYPLVLFLPTLELVKNFRLDSLIKMARQLIFLAFRYIPFFLIASLYGIFSYGTHGTKNIDLFNLLTTNSKIFTLFNFEYLREIFAILGRFILVKPVSDIFSIVPDQSVFALTGLMFFLTMLLTSLFFFSGKNSGYGRALLAALLLTIEGYVGNMFLNVDFDSNGPVNRYLTISFISFSVIAPLFLFLILEKVLGRLRKINRRFVLVVLIIPVILYFAFLSREYEEYIIEDRSKPAKNFYKQLIASVSKLSGYNIFYFDYALYYPAFSRYENILRGAALDKSVNLAVPYNISIDSIKIVDSFEEFLRFISNPPSGKNVSYYTFYYDEKGLHNTTSKIFALLESGDRTLLSKDQIQYTKNQGGSSIIIKPDNASSLTPINVKLNLTTIPLAPTSFNFPYFGVDNQTDISTTRDFYQKNNIQKDKIFKYLLAREKYYSSVKIDVESIHIGKQNPASYVSDDDVNTFWLSDQSRWEVDIKPWIKIDLSETRNISKILWRQLPNRVITEFTIEISVDGNIWNEVKNIHQDGLVSDADLVIAQFPETSARYIRFTINNLATGKSPGPGLAEIEVIESEFNNVDLAAALRIKNNPFEYVKDSMELEKTYNYLSQNAKLKIKYVTNRDGPAPNVVFLELPFAMDGMSHEYSFQLPPGGTLLKKIQLGANFPATFFVDNVVLENLSRSMLDKQIEQKCQEFAKEYVYANPFICGK